MTVQQAIAEADHLKPNMYEAVDKIRWLSRLEARIFQEIICTHTFNVDETEITEFTPLTPDDGEKELFAGEPYDELYVRWLEAQIDYNNMEFDAFNNSNAVFESVYGAFRNAYHRSHMPRSERKIYY